MVSNAAPSRDVLNEIVRRIVDAARPDRIILFGSASRGETGPHSDFDILVVKSGAHRLDLTGQIYRALRGVKAAVDIIVVRPEDITRFGEHPGLVIHSALRDGRELYAA